MTRRMYATDASIYEVEPLAVAFPRNADETAAVICAAAEAEVPVTPRGAGSGLVGGALGKGVVLDFSRFQNGIEAFDPESRTVRVGAGVILDQLNQYLRPHGLVFGPDVATSAQATIGGMIANNSSGARVARYGLTADHIRRIQAILADGRQVDLGPNPTGLLALNRDMRAMVEAHAELIRSQFSTALAKRWPGYGVSAFLKDPANLNWLVAGSEGTLAAIVSADLNLVPVPQHPALGLIFFESVAEAMQATVELLPLKPAAIEHIDRVLFDQTRGQLAFGEARRIMQLDDLPCEAVLITEFAGDDVDECLAAFEAKRLGCRKLVLRAPDAMAKIWSLRKAGLSLLTGRKGPAKPTTGIEDAAVAPADLPEYVRALQDILQRRKIEASFYGHAAAGLLHVRPVLDLHTREDLQRFRAVADEVAQLVREFKGSLAAEHGVGMARTEYLAEQLGPELTELMCRIKEGFDPDYRFNPGKILDDGRYRIDCDLRQGPDRPLRLPFEPVLAFAAKDESFLGNLEQCNGCATCRKAAPTMCPTFLATGDELMSTRGRANLIRSALRHCFDGETTPHPLAAKELDAALSNCISCKGCTPECPSNVNMALLKAELMYARMRREGPSFRARVLSHVDFLGALGTIAPRWANALLRRRPVRKWMQYALGLTEHRPLPDFTERRFDRWFHSRRSRRGSRFGRVILWDDTFVRYYEPGIGEAAVRVLEAAGFEVLILKNRRCCGRPAFSQGVLDRVRRLGAHNLGLLRDYEFPVIFLEPSCWSMFVEDYRELGLAGAESLAERCFLFEAFLERHLQNNPDALTFRDCDRPAAIHAHCHAKSIVNPAFMTALLNRVPNGKPRLLDTGCCGMAGAFGVQAEKYDLSRRVAAPMLEQINALPETCQIIASGTSCRQQLNHFGQAAPLHAAEWLARWMAP